MTMRTHILLLPLFFISSNSNSNSVDKENWTKTSPNFALQNELAGLSVQHQGYGKIRWLWKTVFFNDGEWQSHCRGTSMLPPWLHVHIIVGSTLYHFRNAPSRCSSKVNNALSSSFGSDFEPLVWHFHWNMVFLTPSFQTPAGKNQILGWAIP